MKRKYFLMLLLPILILMGCTKQGKVYPPPTPTAIVVMTSTPTPTDTPTPTPTDTPTPTFTPTPTDTPTPTFTPTPTNTPTPTPIPVNVVFNETYLSIIKERLQTYTTAELGDALTSSSFANYETPYRVSDYENYRITEDQVIFSFPENTLCESHPAFEYVTDLAEAKLFMNYDEEGNPIKDTRIRKDLDPNAPMLCLTFDDGPYDKVDLELIKILEKYNARATFFICTNRLKTKQWADSTIAVYNAGHQIGSHTMSHPYFRNSSFNPEQFWKEVNGSCLSIAKLLGHAPSMIRMPGGLWVDYMTNCPLPMILWNVSSGDTGNLNALEGETPTDVYNRKVKETSTNVIKSARDAGVSLMHSIKNPSPEATEIILEELSQKGYIFVTLEELEYYKGYDFQKGTEFPKWKR